MSPKPGVRIFAKLEGQNPSGSIKDRIVLAMVEEAERRGVLHPGDTVVEASSGNTAIALSLIGKQKGYSVQVVIPGEVAPSIGDLLGLYGSGIVWCEPRAGMKGAIDLAQELSQPPGHFYLGQFDNRANLETHYRHTGEEIVRDLPSVDAFVAGIGTGGTITGVARRLREANPEVTIVGVEPRMGEALQGLSSLTEGYVPPLLDLKQLNRRFLVDSATAITTSHDIIEKEGIFAGISSGATLHAALRVAGQMDRGNIVVMFSDGGWKYLPARPWDAARQGSEELDETHWW
jgi:cysteine synthase B